MSEQNRFRFSIGNLLWMMVPLAIMFAWIRIDFVSGVFALAIGGPAAVGALSRGWSGMWVATRGSAACYFLAFVVVAFVMTFMRAIDVLFF